MGICIISRGESCVVPWGSSDMGQDCRGDGGDRWGWGAGTASGQGRRGEGRRGNVTCLADQRPLLSLAISFPSPFTVYSEINFREMLRRREFKGGQCPACQITGDGDTSSREELPTHGKIIPIGHLPTGMSPMNERPSP